MNEHSIKEDIFNILRLLSSNDSLTQRDLSTHLGFSLGKTNYLLNSLIQKNLIKIRNFTARANKLKKIKYILTKMGFEEKLKLTFHFLERKEKEYLELKKELEKISDKSQNISQKIKV